MLLKLAKYCEPILFTMVLAVCIYELTRVKRLAEIRKYTKGQEKKLRILWITLSFILLVMIILKLV